MEERKSLDERLINHVYSDNYQPVKPKVIAKQLKLKDEEFKELKRSIKRLVRKGRLTFGAKHIVKRAPKNGSQGVLGVFKRASSGFGFVRPEATDRAVGRDADIYIPRRKTLDASSGDEVRVRLLGPRHGDEKPRGEIVEIVNRERYRFVGTFHERSGVAAVQVDGNVFGNSVPIGDPGALLVDEGDKVVIEMVEFPTHYDDGQGVLVEVLGGLDEEGVDTLSIIHEFGLPGPFPEEVIEEARLESESFDSTELDGRADWTRIPTLTIDPKDARDFDDAISLEKTTEGHWRLAVHIADVAKFVARETSLDDEAKKRATSVYLPDRVIPMLPETISNHLASLQPRRRRFAKTVITEFDPTGIPIAVDIESSVIRSDRRFTYEEVDEYLADARPWQEKLSPEIFKLLADMHEFAMLLRGRRLRRGALELVLPEVKIDLNRKGQVVGAHLVENTESHQIIEEFMLATNESVAQWLHDRQIPFLRRIHAAPNERRLKGLTSFVRELGIRCEDLTSRFEIQRVIDAVRGAPHERAVNYAVLKSMQKAFYGPQDEGHYALHSECYCHFTSPIRRYPDLQLHRAIDDELAGKPARLNFNQLLNLGDHCSDREQRAEAAERELVKVKLLSYLLKHRGLKMTAVITGVEDFGFFAQGLELPAEGLVHVTSLQDDYYDFEAKSHSLTGRRAGNSFRLGDVVEVQVDHVDIARRELDLIFIRRSEVSQYGTSKKRPSRKSKAKRSSKSGKKRSTTKKGKSRAQGRSRSPGKKSDSMRRTTATKKSKSKKRGKRR